MKRILAIALAPFLMSACVADVFDSGQQGSEADDVGDGSDDGGDGDFDRDDCKIEGSAIGVAGYQLPLGDVTVVFESWTQKDGEPGEFVGFSLSTTTGTPVGYVVKTGGERWHSTDSTWQHPNGTGGPEVPGISNIDFCEECEDGSCDPGGDDPGDDCTNPDGCDGDPGDTGDPTDPGDDCTDPDGCDGGDGGGGDGGECVTDDDCATGELCEGGTCQNIVL